MTYDLKTVKAPSASGPMLHALAFLLENRVTGRWLAEYLLDGIDIRAVRARPDGELSAAHPVFCRPPGQAEPPVVDTVAPVAPPEGFAFETAHDVATAYRTGALSPVTVAERVLAASAATEREATPLRIFIAQDAADVRAQAAASAERHRRGEALGPLDGVPIAVKDEIPQVPYQTTGGTRFMGTSPATRDAELVTRLRAAGALLIGKTNMHEVGLGPSGINPHHGTARNPYDPLRIAGGSSSGSAAAVAAGLCPIAIGADGGGSIRIPAALCGIVGLKPTFGRVSAHGAFPNCWSVDHYGPMGATVRDVAVAYMHLAGVDARDPHTGFQPPPTLHGVENHDLRGVRLGVFRPWFEDADPGVVAACRETLARLEAAGATVVEIEIPELGLMRTVHFLTIVGEMFAAARADYEHHRADFCLESRVNFALLRWTRPEDYLQAQRHRARLCRQFEAVLRGVDAIVTPTTACTAVRLGAAAAKTGLSDIQLAAKLMRFTQPANLTGLPAISFPAGYDADGMPVGFQAIGRAWDEALLLRLAAVAERQSPRRRPQVHHPLLAGNAHATELNDMVGPGSVPAQ
jgi:Asp-tRNA(Asn)/Glu-tRNA(Gln) amidotransferase A subunit family amidase